jgi:hypothetical protein
MDSASQRLNVGRNPKRKSFREPVNPGVSGQAHVLSKSSLGLMALETENVVPLTHPVAPFLAEAAHPTGDNLLHGHPVSEGNTVFLLCPFSQGHHLAEELMPWNDWSHHVRRMPIATPHPGIPVEGLHIPSADTASPHPDEDFLRTNLWNRNLLKTEVIGIVVHHRFHLAGKVEDHLITHNKTPPCQDLYPN